MIPKFLITLSRDLYRQPLRTILTLSGIIWGTFSVVILVAFGTGLEKQNMKRFHGMGQGITFLHPGVSTMAYKGFTKGRQVDITPDEAEGLKERLPGIQYISPEYIRNASIRYGRQQLNNTVRGVNITYSIMRNIIPSKGRYLNETDLKERRRMCFIGNTIAKDLFNKEEPVGKQIIVNGIPFTVVGVMIKKTQNGTYNGQRDENCIFIPWTTYRDIYGERYVRTILVRPAVISQYEKNISDLRSYLGERYGFSPHDKDALFIWSTTEFEEKFGFMFTAFTIFFAVIGACTLLVGGVGVAAIMLVVVEERTREIGIKLAVGAKRNYILRQFFFESLTIVFAGGIIGFLLSAVVLGVLPEGEFNEIVGVPKLNPVVGITTIILLGCIGVISGFLPAKRAASTNPIEALRK